MAALTKAKAIKSHRDMWNWIADQLEDPNNCNDIVVLQEYYCKLYSVELFMNCFCCEYTCQVNHKPLRTMNAIKCDPACAYCPLEWGSQRNRYKCKDIKRKNDQNGLWSKAFFYSQKQTDKNKAVDIARQIANLPERPDILEDYIEEA